MREIKFRAWDKDKNRMVIQMSGFSEDFDIFKFDEWFHNSGYVLMLFTGLKDRNGVDVCEKDIIKKGNFNHVIVWNNEQAMFGYYENRSVGRIFVSNCYDSITDSEVIGDVYQNPELMKETV